MRDLSKIEGIIEAICDADRPIGRTIITAQEIEEIYQKQAEIKPYERLKVDFPSVKETKERRHFL